MIVKKGNDGYFEDGDDCGKVLAFGRDTGGRYGMMEYQLSPGRETKPQSELSFGPHIHHEIEETFFVRNGTLEFLLDNEVVTLNAGDFVRVPPGKRHGYLNLSDQPVELLVSFHPGGFEELFIKHRTDQEPPPPDDGFVRDAVRDFASEFENT